MVVFCANLLGNGEEGIHYESGVYAWRGENCSDGSSIPWLDGFCTRMSVGGGVMLRRIYFLY